MTMARFVLFFFIFLSASTKALAAPAKIMDLSNLPEKTQQEILRQMPSFQSGDFKPPDIDQLIRYLIIQEQYDSAEVRLTPGRSVNHYQISIGKNRRISSLKIQGNESFSDSTIRKQFGVKEKAIFDQQSLIEAGDRVRIFYRESGFQNAVIDLEFARLSPTDVGVTIKVKEGLQTKVHAIQLNANNPEFQKRFEQYLKKKLVGEPLTDRLLSELQKNIREEFSDRHYYKADLPPPVIELSKDESQARLTFTVVNSDQYIIDYSGAKKMSEGNLNSALELDKFYSANPAIGPEMAARLKTFYLAEGYARAEVTSEESDGPSTHIKIVTLKITEGPRIKIEEIIFTGRFSQTQKYYQNFIEDHSSDLVSRGYYQRDSIETGLKNLIIERQNHGYLRAKVISTKTTYQGEKKDRIIISINIDEGPLTLLDAVTFEGTKSFPEKVLLGVTGLHASEPLKLNELDAAIEKIKSFYHSSGYLEMAISNEKEDLVLYNDDSTLATVNFKIFEGPKVIVASILVEGNSLTKESVVFKELEFKVGDVLTPEVMDESIGRLQRLGLFASVDIRTLEDKTQVAQRTVIVRVQDRDPGLFNMGVGASNERQLTLRGYTGVAYRNILGTGRGASIRAEGNYNIADIRYLERKVTLGYLEPYLFDTRMKGRVTYTQAVSIIDPDKKIATDVKQYTYSIEQDISSHVSISYDLLSSAQVRKFGIEENTTFPSEETIIVTTGPTLEIDYRDHPFNPTKGSFTRINAEYSRPGMGSSSTIDYYRAFASYTQYNTLWKSGWVWANSIRGGYLRNQSHAENGGVPYYLKGLSLGGQGTVRGFEPGEAFPNKYDLSGVDPSVYVLTTDASMYLVKSEIRFPIHGAFGGAIFYDGGAVFIRDQGFQEPYRDGAGLGLRYTTPVGAVSLEWGYKLHRNKERDESESAIYFSIGTF